MTTPENPESPVCPCGEPATTTLEVAWVSGKRRYRYCEGCAEDIVTFTEGTEILP